MPEIKNIRFDDNLLDQNAVEVVKTIHKAGYEVYLVGGCVRDLLLGLKPKDFDVVTDARPEKLRRLFKKSRLIGRRFRLVHVIFYGKTARDNSFIEVATFRGDEDKISTNGTIIRDNNYGTITEDAHRRDFNINALYYDVNKHQIIDYVGGLQGVKSRQIATIGKSSERFRQDPVRMIRAVRFAVKLGTTLSVEIQQAIQKQAPLLANVSRSRLYDECLKLFHNEGSFEIYQMLEKYGLLRQLFSQTKTDDFVKSALLNTADRVKKSMSITPAFIFAVFLWNAQNHTLKQLKNTKKHKNLITQEASQSVITEQIKQLSIPKWQTAKIQDIWWMQDELEHCSGKKIAVLLGHKNFRLAFDFLLLRAKTINPELQKVAKFWTKIQTQGGKNG